MLQKRRSEIGVVVVESRVPSVHSQCGVVRPLDWVVAKCFRTSFQCIESQRNGNSSAHKPLRDLSTA